MNELQYMLFEKEKNNKTIKNNKPVIEYIIKHFFFLISDSGLLGQETGLTIHEITYSKI